MSCCALEKHEMTSSQGGGTLLLATGFNGTIAPIVERPEDAAIHACARRLLERFASAPSLAAAVLSGRDAEDVCSRHGGLRVIVPPSPCIADFGPSQASEEMSTRSRGKGAAEDPATYAMSIIGASPRRSAAVRGSARASDPTG